MANDTKDSARELVGTPWRFGRFDAQPRRSRLLFGRMFEDPTIEQHAFRPYSRVFCIASAGCVAINLAQYGWQVSAVDINPSQVAYVRRRLQGGAVEQGAADRLLAYFRRGSRLLGVRRQALETFVQLNDPAEQIRFWNERLDRRLLRTATKLLLSRPLLGLAYAKPFVRSLPSGFDEILWARVARGISLHPNRDNPFAWRLFLGRERESEGQSPATPTAIGLACADAPEYLFGVPSGSFDAFSLSNILDGVDSNFVEALFRAVRHAAAPRAIAVIRSFAEPRDENERARAASDRSFLWGRIVVCRVDEIDAAMFAVK